MLTLKTRSVIRANSLVRLTRYSYGKQSKICSPNIQKVASVALSRRCFSSFPRSSPSFNFLPNNARNLMKQYRFYSSELPSHIKVALPALSPTMELGTIVSWQKKEGDQLSEGDLLCEIETDKATMGFETPEEGYLAKIMIPEGTKDIPIGKLLCIIVENQDDIAAFKDFSGEDLEAAPSKAEAKEPEPASKAPEEDTQKAQPQAEPQSSPQKSSGDRIKASPYAKKLAAEQGVNLAAISGSGHSGRILSSDISQQPFGGVGGNVVDSPMPGSIGGTGSYEDFQDIPLSNMRKTIAKRLTESKNSIPHYYLTSEIIIDKLVSIRLNLNKVLEKENGKSETKPTKLSINDFVIKASALSCLRVPEANSFFMNTFIRQNNNVDVSVAVSTDVGLITPIIFNAHHKGLATISSEISALAAKARQGKLQPHEFQGGTFTVSNLGMFGSVDHFTAIINPPQSCILAIGGAKKKLIPSDEDEEGHRVVTTLTVTLSCDHRVVDGAVGAVWLRHFKSFLENPQTMLL